MGADPITAGLGAVSLFSQMDANKKAAGKQAKALKGQQAISQRALKLFDAMYKRVSDAEAQGQFDPERYIKQLDKDYLKQEGTDLANMGGAFSAAGYLPGASEVGRSLTAFKTKSQANLDRMRTDLRRQTFADLLNSYSQIGTGGLNLASQIQGQQANMYGGQQNSTAGLFQSIMPFFGNRSGGGGNFGSFNNGPNNTSGSYGQTQAGPIRR